jgi:hypothetical protein
VGVDFVALCLAAMDGFHIQGMTKGELDLFLKAKIK